MPLNSRARSLLRTLFGKRSLDLELDEELQSCLEILTQEKIAAGMDSDLARRKARLELGGAEQVKESVRQRRIGAAFDALLQDVRYGLRSLRRDAGFSVVVILILALGIGAVSALFGTVNSILLRSMPFDDPDRLVTGFKTRNGVPAGPVSLPDYRDFHDRCGAFEELAMTLWGANEQTLTGGDEPVLVDVGWTTWNLFRTLGVTPVLGRGFREEEGQATGAPVAVLSHRMWQSRYGGSPDVLDQTLEINGSPVTIVGVLPSGFRYLFDADLWLPEGREGPFDVQRDSHSHLIVGRLASGVSLEQAQSEADAIAAGLAEQYPDTNKGKGLGLVKLHEFLVERVRTMLLMLMAATVLVLLIACGNAAGLLLARGQRRHGEMAMRASLGATRGRLVRQVLTETILLTLCAGAAGIGLAYLFQGLVLPMLPTGRVGTATPGIDATTLLFTTIVSILAGLLVGVLPALRGTSASLFTRLQPGSRTSESLHGTRLRGTLVIAQVAVSIVLLIGAGLLIRSLVQLATVDLGFSSEGLLSGRIRIQAEDYPEQEQRVAFFRNLLTEIEALPAVESAAVVSRIPIRSRGQDWPIWHATEPRPSMQDSYFAYVRWVSPGYFRTMGMPLREGRDIGVTDVAGSPRVMVISESVARRLFSGQDPLGRQVKMGWSEEPLEVIGVVADARLNGLRRQPEAAMYVPVAQTEATQLWLAVRSSGDPALLAEPIRHLVRAKDPTAMFVDPMLMSGTLDDVLADFRAVILNLGVFAGVALALTAMGLYGVLAYHVAQRTREIGIRQALGASHSDLLRWVLCRGLWPAAIGILAGLACAYPGTLFLRQLLFEVEPLDPGAYLGAVVLFALIALLACLLPAWRATQVSVATVLRGE